MINNEFPHICQKITALTKDISRLIFYPHPKNEKKLSYEAGQYVEVVLLDFTLPLSIANAPHPNQHLEFHLRHNAEHKQAQRWMSTLEEGKVIHFRGPMGQSTLSRLTAPYHALLFLAGGTGFAPIKALLEKALTDEKYKNVPLYLYWGVRRSEDAYDEKLLIKFKETYQNFQYILALSDNEYPHEILEREHPEMENVTVFASGPLPLIKAARALFKKRGLKNERMICD